MPEGPSIVILKEALHDFVGKKIKEASGNTKKVDLEALRGKKIVAFKSWGKHFLICFNDFSLRIHFLLFGSYRINEVKENSNPRLSLKFTNKRFLNFYACAISTIESPLDQVYDWSADVMNEKWSSKAALKKLREKPTTLVCDALLDQNIFSGVGNIIKNEVLFRVKVHPKSQIGKLPPAKQRELIREAVTYSFQFLEWKKQFVLKANWLAHTKKTCPRDKNKIIKEYLGKTNRRTFYCNKCQKLYR